ncbi:hypothetical protein ACFY7H_12845 [Streptomyces sp. NPDC012794]|uniref:hypothetical protein n=1 Tax=Streptomyces sp. NPDC012794 TaxID=3364850 RepID=UPI003674270F
MSYRPYPNADRARRQVARHAQPPRESLPPWAAKIVSAYEPGAWHPDAIFDPETKRFILWPAA